MDFTGKTATTCSSSDDDDEEYNQVPECFICPLTLECMNDPLMDRRGTSFERSAILEWLNRGKKTCPLTRQPLSFSKLIPNAKLRIEIQQWKTEHGMNSTSTAYPSKAETEFFVCEALPNSMLNRKWTTSQISSVMTEYERQIRQVSSSSDSDRGRRRLLSSLLDSALSAVRRSRSNNRG